MKRQTAAPERNIHANAATGLLAYCRPGFEGECAQELAQDASGFVRAERGSGFAELVRNEGAVASGDVTWRELIFARQLLHLLGRAQAMSRNDRLA